MNFQYIKRLPSSKEIIDRYPMPAHFAKIKKEKDKAICDILSGASDKFLAIVGPCSADNEDAVCEYTLRLAKIQENVADRIVIVPRVYTNKPRTTGEGYKGILHQPDPEKEPDMVSGIIAMRRMHLRIISETGFTPADEMLYPENYTYLEDILSYVAIGARSVENQQHRLTVSGMDIPVGMKNPTSGDMSIMLNSVVAAQYGHTFIYQGYEVKTFGNPYAHTILRGAINHYGKSIPNYHFEDLYLLHQMYEKRELENKAVIVDANHANSGKKYDQQPRIINEVMHSRSLSPEIRKLVRGVMIESYIVEGCQNVGDHVFGKSITDACLGIDDTEELIYSIAEHL